MEQISRLPRCGGVFAQNPGYVFQRDRSWHIRFGWERPPEPELADSPIETVADESSIQSEESQLSTSGTSQQSQTSMSLATKFSFCANDSKVQKCSTDRESGMSRTNSEATLEIKGMPMYLTKRYRTLTRPHQAQLQKSLYFVFDWTDEFRDVDKLAKDQQERFLRAPLAQIFYLENMARMQENISARAELEEYLAQLHSEVC